MHELPEVVRLTEAVDFTCCPQQLTVHSMQYLLLHAALMFCFLQQRLYQVMAKTIPILTMRRTIEAWRAQQYRKKWLCQANTPLTVGAPAVYEDPAVQQRRRETAVHWKLLRNAVDVHAGMYWEDMVERHNATRLKNKRPQKEKEEEEDMELITCISPASTPVHDIYDIYR